MRHGRRRFLVPAACGVWAVILVALNIHSGDYEWAGAVVAASLVFGLVYPWYIRRRRSSA